MYKKVEYIIAYVVKTLNNPAVIYRYSQFKNVKISKNPINAAAGMNWECTCCVGRPPATRGEALGVY